MTPESAPRLRADAARNRDQVLRAARQALVENSLALNMNELARRAGVGVGTVYRHFPTRQALVETLVHDRFSHLLGEALAGLEDEPGPALERFVAAAVRLEVDEPGVAEVLAATSDATADSATIRRELLEAVERLLARGRAAGAVRDDVSADDLRRLVCGIEHAVRSGEGDPDVVADRYVRLLLEGLRPRG